MRLESKLLVALMQASVTLREIPVEIVPDKQGDLIPENRGAVGDRRVRQAAQASAETVRPYQLFGQRDPMAGLGGVDDTPDPPAIGMSDTLGPELREDVCAGARRYVAAAGQLWAAGQPWDSRSCFCVWFMQLPSSSVFDGFWRALRT